MMITLGPTVNNEGYTGIYGNWDGEGVSPLMFDDKSQAWKPVVLNDGLVPAIPVSERYTQTFNLPAPTNDNEVIDYFRVRVAPEQPTLLALYAIYTDMGRTITREVKLGNICAFGTYEYQSADKIPSSWTLQDRSGFEFFIPISASEVEKSIMVLRPLIGVNQDGTQATSCWLKRERDLRVSIYWAKRNADDTNMIVKKLPYRVLVPTGYDSTTIMKDGSNMGAFKEEVKIAIEDLTKRIASLEVGSQSRFVSR